MSSPVAPASSAQPPEASDGERPRKRAKPLFPDWLPWEKILIWGLFFLVVYTLRHFFFIIFMTFILTYIMRSVVRKVARFALPGRENIWLERSLSVAGFVLLLLGLYASGNYLGPKLFLQGKALVNQMTLMQPRKQFDTFFGTVVGPYLFYREYGDSEDPQYIEAFENFEGQIDPAGLAFGAFDDIDGNLKSAFLDAELLKIKKQLQPGPDHLPAEQKFRSWFLREKAPEIFEKDSDTIISRWEAKYRDAATYLNLPPLEDRQKRADYGQYIRERTREMIFEDLDEVDRELYRHEWEGYVLAAARLAFQSSPQYTERLREFYARARQGEVPSLAAPSLSYEFDKYLELQRAYKEGPEAFSKALGALDLVLENEEEKREQAHTAFRKAEADKLANEVLGGPLYARIEANLLEYSEAGLRSLVGWIQGAIAYLVTIPVQLALSLLLSFFITLDMPRLRRGIFMLKQSRVSDFYEEIAPGLYNFGRLIGRTFQAQGVIAIFNTILTFVAIRTLQIDNEVFLCAIVFVCSFIPVLGVVLSSLPIAVVAIVQPGGSIVLALQAIAAILVIHFIETSVLNPKILGDMLHLHPVMVLAVLAIGEHFSGIWGLLLAVPVTVYIIRCVILDQEIPGLIEQDPLARVSRLARENPPVEKSGEGAVVGDVPSKAGGTMEGAGKSVSA